LRTQGDGAVSGAGFLANWGKLGQIGAILGQNGRILQNIGLFHVEAASSADNSAFFPMKKYAISDIHFNVY
jgi:hypothetical protein